MPARATGPQQTTAAHKRPTGPSPPLFTPTLPQPRASAACPRPPVVGHCHPAVDMCVGAPFLLLPCGAIHGPDTPPRFLLCEARRGALTVKFSPSTLSPPTKSSCDTRHLPSCLLFEHDHWEAAAAPKSRGSAAVATPFSEPCLRALLRRFSCTSPLPSAPCCRTRQTCQWPPGEARAAETSPSRSPFLPRHGTPYSGELRSQNLA
jgi:hypothetical protein